MQSALGELAPEDEEVGDTMDRSAFGATAMHYADGASYRTIPMAPRFRL